MRRAAVFPGVGPFQGALPRAVALSDRGVKSEDGLQDGGVHWGEGELPEHIRAVLHLMSGHRSMCNRSIATNDKFSTSQ